MEYLWPNQRTSFKRLTSLILTSIILIPISVVNLSEAENTSIEDNVVATVEKLPFCGEDNQRTINRRLLYITTLDGKLSALDVSQSGKLRWSIPTEPGPLISSSIHRLELTNNGQWVRMIPSLSGGLYKFDGDSLDPIPITAENLLSSSFKFSDDLVISGGKETRTYGVSARTGQILYKCSMNGCLNETDSNEKFGPPKAGDESYLNEHDPMVDDVLVVRRQTQTVRAVEPRTGSERWNFSVGHHEVEVLKSSDCHVSFSELDMAVLDLDIRVVVPEGIICAFSKQEPNVMLWKYKFDHPIVSAWRTDANDKMQTIDLFGSAQWLWNGGAEGFTEQEGLVSPSIYIGMFQKQLYIQESRSLEKLVSDETKKISQHMKTNESKFPLIPWKPYPASSSALAVINKEDENIIQDQDPNTAALSVLYASEYVNGNGFYLYSSTDINETEKALCDSDNSTKTSSDGLGFYFDNADTPIKFIIFSLWYWWKEIIVIALTSALVLNLVLSPKIRREREFVVIEKHIPVPTASEATEEMFTKSRSTERSISESYSTASDNFTSRFSTDFDLIQCLGKGGFGVVFEAKNKLDDCNYAIKRIVLPNKKESRERVLREVKTLANCEHHNIVRYFQAWVESPPPGWQDTEDMKWIARRDFLSTSIDIETPDGTTLPSYPKDSNFNDSTTNNRNKKLDSWISSLNSGIPQFNNINRDLLKDSSAALDWNRDESSSYIQFKEDSNLDESQSTNKQPIAADDEDDSDSFEIEFKHSTNGQVDDQTQNTIDTTSSCCKSKSRVCHLKSLKRPMSLDLTSKGDVIVPMPEKCQQKVYLYIQMQLCRKQSLREWMRECKADNRQSRVNNIFEQIVDAVDYVHLKGLIHRDLKPGNIFFSLDDKIKIGDFGLVTDMSESPNVSCSSETNSQLTTSGIRRTQQVGTHLYMSPEQLDGRPYDFKVDIFSLGLIFFELLVDFGTEMERIVTLRKLRIGQFPIDFQEKFIAEHDLLRRMLATVPTERPATSEIKDLLTTLGNRDDNFGRTVANEMKDVLIKIPSNLESVVRSTVKYGIIADNE